MIAALMVVGEAVGTYPDSASLQLLERMFTASATIEVGARV